MVKLTKLVSKFIKKQKDETLDDFSKFYVQIALRKELTQKAFKYKNEISEAYEYYIDKYYNIIYYLNEDFKIEKLKLNGSSTDLNEELGFKEEFEKIINMHLLSRIKVMDKFNLTKISKKWYLLNIIFGCYIEALSKLEKVSKVQQYKTINFIEEKDKYNSDNYLVEDFSHFAKK